MIASSVLHKEREDGERHVTWKSSFIIPAERGLSVSICSVSADGLMSSHASALELEWAFTCGYRDGQDIARYLPLIQRCPHRTASHSIHFLPATARGTGVVESKLMATEKLMRGMAPRLAAPLSPSFTLTTTIQCPPLVFLSALVVSYSTHGCIYI